MDFPQVVDAEASRISQIARTGPLDARVPHIPRWTVSDVVAHLGGVHRWAAGVVESGSMETGHRRGRDTGDALIDWFDEGADYLVDVLSTTPVDQKCANFSRGSPKVVGFWLRRQAHETTMHRWDAESATDSLSPIDPVLAADGIDELFRVFTRTRGKQVLAGPVRFAPSDSDLTWTVGPVDPAGRVDLVDADPVAVATGTSENLLLVLWKRLPLDAVSVSGDRQIVADFVAGPISP